VHTYDTLPDTTVTLTGTTELHITGTTGNPISGSMIQLDSADAWFFMDNVKPSALNSTYLRQIRVNGAAATLNSNVRIVQYGEGAVVIPQSPNFAAMQVFSGPNFTGSSMSLSTYNTYNDTQLGALSNDISSFKLKRGYEATVAQYSNGTGVSKNYVAQDGDIEVNLMPTGLDNSVSFVRVFPWRWSTKKGAANLQSGLDLGWWYNWDINSSSSLDLDYVPIRQHTDRPTLDQDWAARGSNELLGFNEPDRPDQSNMSVDTAVSIWPELLGTGLRVGAPAVSDGGRDWWLYPFMDDARAAGDRVDFVPIHYYQGHNPADPQGAATQMYNYLKSVYDRTGLPIWITEWNNGANWTNSGDPTYAQQAAAIDAMTDMLDKAPFVERYAIYNWVEDVRRVKWDDGSLTQAGVVYRDKKSPLAYTQQVPESVISAGAVYDFDGSAADTSGRGNNAILHGAAEYAPGKNGQAISLSGDAASDDYVSLSPKVGDSTDFTFGTWVNWSGGATGQKIFEFADDLQGLATKYMYISPNAGNGVKFAIYNGSTQQELNYSAAIPAGTWTHVAVTISGNTGKLFINGALVATNTGMTINPVDLGTISNYLGRGRKTTDPLFAGELDGVTFLPYAISDAQVAAMQTNAAPVFVTDAIDGGTATAGVAYSGSVAGKAFDANGGTLTYAKPYGPAWLTVAANGTLSGTPPVGTDGPQEFVISVTDSAGAVSTAALTISMASHQGNGVWTSLTGQNWNTDANWSNNFVASGANETADFGTLNIPADKTVTLDGPRTIGGLKFGDMVGAQDWTLNSSGAGSVLTLEGDGPTITVNQDTATISAPIAGKEGFNKLGNGTLVLGGANTGYTGDTTVSQGILNLQNSSALGSNSVVNQAAGARNSAIELQGNVTTPTYVRFVLSNDGGLQGTATLPYALDNVSGNNTINGLIYLTVGGGNSVIQSDAGALTLNGTIRPYPRIGARTLILQGDSTAGNIVNGLLSNHTSSSDILSLIKNGLGVWRIENDNTYTGGTTINAGQLHIGSSTALGTGKLTINGGTLVPRLAPRTLANPVTVGGNFGLSLVGFNNSMNLSGAINLGAAIRTITVGDTTFDVDSTLSGVISNGGLIKAGAGTLVLSGANTYTGATTVSGGTLRLGGVDRIANASAVTLAGGTFSTDGFSETVGALGLSADSSIDLGDGASTLTFSGAGAFAAGRTLTVTHWSAGSDHLFVGSSAGLTAAQLAQINLDGVGVRQLSTGEIVPDSTPPVLVAAASRKPDASGGMLDLPLDLGTGAVGVEPRAGGPTTLVFDFSEPVVAADGALGANEFVIANASFASASVAGSRLTLEMTGAADASIVSVSLQDLTDAAGNALAATSLSVGALGGDITRDAVVDFNDLVVLAQNYNTSGAATLDRGDVNFDGHVDFGDLVLLAQHYNVSLPPAPSPTVSAAQAAPALLGAVDEAGALIPDRAVTSTRAEPVFNATTRIKPAAPQKPLRRSHASRR
jgi:autotransporter-associated beta strand protein